MKVRDGEALPATPLVIACGKGGVGRSSAATALAHVYAARGERVALVHPADAHPVRPIPGLPAPAVIGLDGPKALHTYLDAQLPGPLASALRASRVFGLITAATPGLSELLTIGELERLLELDYERVVFDAPATGHLLAMFDAPGRFERAAAVGPIAARARHLGAWITDSAQVSCVAVTTGDGLAVSELIDLAAALASRTGHEPELVIANRLAPHSPPEAELERLAAAAGHSAAEQAAAELILGLAARGRSERAQLGRVTKATGVQPLRVVEHPGDGVEAIVTALSGAAA